MDTLTRSLQFQLPQDVHIDNYAQNTLENSSNSISHNQLASTTIPNQSAASDFLHKLGATLLNSIQMQNYQKPVNSLSSNSNQMNANVIPNHIVIDTSPGYSAMEEIQKQLEYDKFMNEVWIGVVLTLIFISMIFCFCSCFLYHQFRIWKRNYRSTVTFSSSSLDIESPKTNTEYDDPVPEYTLVSGLPSYEAALKLLQKSPKNSCLLVQHPSVFHIFNRHEKTHNEITDSTVTSNEVNTPLLTESQTIATNNQATDGIVHVQSSEKSVQSQPVVILHTVASDKAIYKDKSKSVQKCDKS
uniref:Protein commissureless n=1 Tax=Glossina palpalis gambiensis TaxID=67801 RepID=A0A1B0AR00_9MUSC